MSRPWYPFYPSDYHRDTKFLSPMADLVYRRLLDLYWENQAPIPANFAAIGRAIGLDTRVAKRYLQGELSPFWLTCDAGYYNARMKAEMEKCQQKQEHLAEAGRKGGLAKAKANAEPDALARPQPQPDKDIVVTNVTTSHRSHDEDYNTQRKSGKKPPPKKPDKIPYEKIRKLFIEILCDPDNPPYLLKRPVEVTDKRKGHIRQLVRKQGMSKLKDWREYFEFIRLSRWLMGMVPPSPGRKPFELTFDYVILETNYIKIIERKYHG